MNRRSQIRLQILQLQEALEFRRSLEELDTIETSTESNILWNSGISFVCTSNSMASWAFCAPRR